jgi:hypothetical protein
LPAGGESHRKISTICFSAVSGHLGRAAVPEGCL